MAEIKFSGYTHRFLARFVIEAKTPLAVGSGEKDIITDALVAKDVNGLPYIPGTAIAGVVRSMLKQQDIDNTDEFFGFQKKNGGEGSQIIFTEAKILNSKGQVVDGIDLDAENDDLLKHFKDLPIRQHARINEMGVTVKGAKFDEQVVFAGTRFCFELEMVAKSKDTENFDNALKQIQSKSFRIGSGTRCGFGEIEVIDLFTATLNLKDNLQEYLDKPSNLQQSKDWNLWTKQVQTSGAIDGWTEYKLILHPEDFFMFGSGFGDDEADMTPVKSRKISWKDGKAELKNNLVLIPATSVKGALAHRVAFHYNVLVGNTADKLKPEIDAIRQDTSLKKEEQDKKIELVKDRYVGKNNEAVKILFGSEGEKIGNKMKDQARGNLIFSDIIENPVEDKILNHVAIDRFTGGAIDGALFSEKTTYGKGQEYEFTILANNEALKDENIKEALKLSLNDICSGLLPLGGGVNRGNGVFTGSFTINEKLYESR